jgi:hypothetical protein
MIKPQYEIGEELIINHPKDKKYHGLKVKVEAVDKYDAALTYCVEVFDKYGKPLTTRLWLPGRLLLPNKSRNIDDLIPGDIIFNGSGQEFEVLEPRSKIYFVSPVGNKMASSYVSAENLIADGFKLKAK